MGVGLLVGVWMARYLGPEQFGLLNFATALVALFGAVAALGLKDIIVRDIVKEPESANITLGTGFILRLIGGLISFLILSCVIIYLRQDDFLSKIIVAILGFTLIFKSSEIVKFWFESQVKSKYSVWVENSVFLAIAGIRVVMILAQAPLMAFVLAFFAEAFLVAVFLLLTYKIKAGSLTDWKVSFGNAKKLLQDSWPLLLSGVAIFVAMRIDQVMLGQIIGDQAVGIYSAAIRISEVWYFIPMAIMASFFPSIVSAKKTDEALYYKKLQKLYDLMIWLGISVALIMTFLSDWIINLLFGLEYSDAGTVLKIHIWAGFSAFPAYVWGAWIITENKQKVALFAYILAALFNVIFNLILIKHLGINGAALATLLGTWLSTFIAYALYKPSKSYGLLVNSFNPRRLNRFYATLR